MESVDHATCGSCLVARPRLARNKPSPPRLILLPLTFLLTYWPLSLAQAQNCPEAENLSVALRARNVPVQKVGDGVIFRAGMEIDADGAPNAYGPNNSGLDDIRNAQSCNETKTKCSWVGVVTDENGKPVPQPSGPFPGYYVSKTSLQLKEGNEVDPTTYVNATEIPYIALPPQFVKQFGIALGDLALVTNQKNGKSAYAIYAEIGPGNKIGEGSIALAKALGFKNSSPRTGGVESGIQFMVFPKSGLGQGKLRTLDEINASGAKVFHDWGGSERLSNCDNDASWQIALQKQRMDAAAAGNIDLYNRLLQLHAEIFKQRGLRACESAFYPGGCNSAPAPRGQAAQAAAGSCPPFSPRNTQDALQVENSSHKDVCWAYDGKTLVATSSKSPDKANKPSLPNSNSVGGTPSSALSTSTVDTVAPSSRPVDTAAGAAPVDATITKTSHSRWDTRNPLFVGRGQTSVIYYPASQGKSYIYVAHLVTKSQVKPGSKAQLAWCSALLFNGIPFTYDTFAHNRNYAILGACSELENLHFDESYEVAVDEKGKPFHTASGERLYVAGSRIDVELDPGVYKVVVCPPYPAFHGDPPDDWGDTPIYRLVPRGNPFEGPTAVTCQSEDNGLHGMGKEHWSGPLPPLGIFTVNLSPGMSATVTVKSY